MARGSPLLLDKHLRELVHWHLEERLAVVDGIEDPEEQQISKIETGKQNLKRRTWSDEIDRSDGQYDA